MCGKQYVVKIYLDSHKESLHFETKITCELCGKTFSSNLKIKHHKSTYHMQQKRKKYNCTHCGNDYGHQFVLDRHIKTVHERRREFACHKCGKTFTQETSLHRHLKNIHKSSEQLKGEEE